MRIEPWGDPVTGPSLSPYHPIEQNAPFSRLLPLAVSPRIRSIKHSGISGPSTSHLHSFHASLTSGSFLPGSLASWSMSAPLSSSHTFLLSHSLLLLVSHVVLELHFNAHHPVLTGKPPAKYGNTKSHWDQDSPIGFACSLLPDVVVQMLLDCWLVSSPSSTASNSCLVFLPGVTSLSAAN